MFRVIIAGTRDFNDYDLLKKYCDYMLSKKVESGEQITIISGGASGADALGEKYAKERGYSLRLFPAQWEKYGRQAGPMRNREMADNADALIAYWDGKSRGTKNMIEEAKKRGLKVAIKQYAIEAHAFDSGFAE